MESLENKGFVAAKPGKPLKYTAVQPKEALKNVKKAIIAYMEALEKTGKSETSKKEIINVPISFTSA